MTAACPVFHILNPSRSKSSWVRRTIGQIGNSSWAWVAREHPEHTETLVDWALQEKVSRVVVWGGDGTFHRVVRALWRRKVLDRVELALVPVGTCNDLARRLNLTLSLCSWEQPVPEGRLASLTLARLAWFSGESSGEDIFINNAGFGRPRSSFERKDPPWKVLASFRPIRLKALWCEGVLQGLYYMMLVCSAPYFSGGLHFETEPSPEGGVLKLYFVPARSKIRLALKLLSGLLGMPLMDDKTTKLSVTQIALETDIPVWPQVDGEPPPLAGVRRMEFQVLPERVSLWVPRKGL